eukprot:Nk52_evm1s2627 gene=Nk52_evmTU1s2627
MSMLFLLYSALPKTKLVDGPRAGMRIARHQPHRALFCSSCSSRFSLVGSSSSVSLPSLSISLLRKRGVRDLSVKRAGGSHGGLLYNTGTLCGDGELRTGALLESQRLYSTKSATKAWLIGLMQPPDKNYGEEEETFKTFSSGGVSLEDAMQKHFGETVTDASLQESLRSTSGSGEAVCGEEGGESEQSTDVLVARLKELNFSGVDVQKFGIDVSKAMEALDKVQKYGNPDYVRVSKSLVADVIDEYHGMVNKLKQVGDREKEIEALQEIYGARMNKLKAGLAKMFTLRMF